MEEQTQSEMLMAVLSQALVQCRMRDKQKSFQGAVSQGRDSSACFALPGFIALLGCLLTFRGMYLVPDLASALQFLAANALFIEEGEQGGKMLKCAGAWMLQW